MQKASLFLVILLILVIMTVSAARPFAPTTIPPKCPAVLASGHRLMRWEQQGLNHACIYAPPAHQTGGR